MVAPLSLYGSLPSSFPKNDLLPGNPPKANSIIASCVQSVALPPGRGPVIALTVLDFLIGRVKAHIYNRLRTVVAKAGLKGDQNINQGQSLHVAQSATLRSPIALQITSKADALLIRFLIRNGLQVEPFTTLSLIENAKKWLPPDCNVL